jgi:hypothetical protein
MLSATFLILWLVKVEKCTCANSYLFTNGDVVHLNDRHVKRDARTGINRVDHFYYINLDEYTWRRSDMERELFEVCGLSKADVTRIPGIKEKCRALGCSKAHLNALKSFKQSNYENVIIFEDDCTFRYDIDEINRRFDILWESTNTFNVVLLAHNTFRVSPTLIDSLVQTHDSQTLAAYLVNRDYLDTLIENVEEGIKNLSETLDKQYCIDMYWKKLQQSDVWLAFHEPLCRQRATLSAIEGKFMDYGDGLNYKIKPLHNTAEEIELVPFESSLQLNNDNNDIIYRFGYKIESLLKKPTFDIINNVFLVPENFQKRNLIIECARLLSHSYVFNSVRSIRIE